MKRSKQFLLATTGLLAALGQSTVNAAESVGGYLVTSDGSVVKDGSGECIRTQNMGTDYREDCGYELRVEKAAAVETTPIGTAVEIATTAEIVKDDRVLAGGGVVEEVIINNVQFPFDSAELTPEYTEMLDTASELLRPHRPILREGLAQLNVVGYTDSSGPDAYNQKLSERRAVAVADYLIAQDPTRDAFINAMGRGEADPIGDNGTDDGRRMNRRVVLEVIGK
jgi:OOP family OmpA-OmpF porin